MPPETISQILAILHEVSGQGGRLEEALERIDKRLDSKVDRTECAALHAQNRVAVEGLLRREASQPAIPTQVAVQEALEKRQESSRKATTFWLSIVLAAMAVFGGLYTLMARVSQLTAHVEQKTSRDEAYRSELRKELLQLAKQPPAPLP